MRKNSSKQESRKPGPIDLHIGAAIRDARRTAEMTQTEFGLLFDVTFQQVQKYESGKNKIAASRLYEMCKVLKIDMMSIFQSLPKTLR